MAVMMVLNEGVFICGVSYANDHVVVLIDYQPKSKKIETRV